MQLSSVRPSVCPVRPPHTAAAGLLLWARQAGDRLRRPLGSVVCGGRMRVVPRCQLMYEAEHRLVLFRSVRLSCAVVTDGWKQSVTKLLKKHNCHVTPFQVLILQ